MHLSRRAFTGCVAAGLALPATSASAAPNARWRGAIDDIARAVETVHPNTVGVQSAFQEALRRIRRMPASLSDEYMMAQAMELVASLGDGHTQIEPTTDAYRHWYPFRLYEFTDGIFLVCAFGADSDFVGAQVVEIAGRPANEVTARARQLMGADNALDRTERLFVLHNPQLMRALGFAGNDGSLSTVLRTTSGETISKVFTPQAAAEPAFATGPVFDWRYRSEVFGPPLGAPDQWRSAYRGLPSSAFRTEDRTRPLHLMLRRGRIRRALPEAGAYYMQIGYVGNLPDDAFGAFAERALDEVDALRPRALIIDLRYSYGGDGSKVHDFIHAFIRRSEAPSWEHLYVLTGRRTFSAAIMLLAAFIDHTPVSLIGEPAGGALDHYGDAAAIDIPSIGARLFVSTLFHQLQDQGQRYDIMPVDVAAPFSFVDYASGRDPAIDPLLRGDEMRSIPLIAVAEGGAAAARVYHQRKSALAPYSSWMALREFDLVRGIWRLYDLDRRADALELARIMVDLHPNAARAHSMLGDNLIALDQRDAGLAAYREALRLDPFNLDNVSQREALSEAGLTP